MGKNDPQNNLECKFVHPNQNLCAIDPLTPHNATPGFNLSLPLHVHLDANIFTME